MRIAFAAVLAVFCLRLYPQTSLPGWLEAPKDFCGELARRTNGTQVPTPLGRPGSTRFADYPANPALPARPKEAVVGKYDWLDKTAFADKIKAEAAIGPDFAGRYAIITWSCGTSCSNAVVVDVQSGKSYEMPFLGVTGCEQVTGTSATLQRRADSSLLIVRGSLEMTFGDTFGAGPCGTFYFRWTRDRLRLIGCYFAAESRRR